MLLICNRNTENAARQYQCALYVKNLKFGRQQSTVTDCIKLWGSESRSRKRNKERKKEST